MKYHPLTEKLCKKNGYCSYDREDIDSIITKFLLEAALSIKAGPCSLGEHNQIMVDEILGLQPSGEKDPKILMGTEHRCPSGAPQPKEVGGIWTCCDNQYQSYKFCPYCSKPRPTPRSLREELAEEYMRWGKAKHWQDGIDFYLKMADVAIEFLYKQEK